MSDIKVKIGDLFEYKCGCSAKVEMITVTASIFRPRQKEEKYHVVDFVRDVLCEHKENQPIKRIVRGKRTVWQASND